MRWYASDHEQFISFSIQHSGTSWSLSHQSIGCCSRTVQAFLDVVWQTLIWSSCLRLTNGLHVVVNYLYLLWWSLLLNVDYDTDTSTPSRVFVHQGNNYSVITHSCFPWSSVHFGVPELTSAFFLFKNVPNSWFGQHKCFCYLSDGFV